jgi:hypothetical protein
MKTIQEIIKKEVMEEVFQDFLADAGESFDNILALEINGGIESYKFAEEYGFYLCEKYAYDYVNFQQITSLLNEKYNELEKFSNKILNITMSPIEFTMDDFANDSIFKEVSQLKNAIIERDGKYITFKTINLGDLL